MYIINKKNLKKKKDWQQVYPVCECVIKVHSVKCEKQEKTITVLSAEKKEKRRRKKNTFSLWSAFVKKNPQSRKIKNYCLDLFCRLDENVNWIFLCNENVWFFKCKIAHCANWETNILNEWLYTPYHFTVNINLIKELERRRKPISRLSKHPDWLAHWGKSL